jgi:hypothetical protein
MKFCEHCKVYVKGSRKNCPLCENTLTGDNTEDEIFPTIPETYQYNLILRIMIFLTICISALSIAVKTMFPMQLNWPLFVIGGMICTWISLYLVIKQRHNIPKSLVWQVGIITIFAVIWDIWTGWHGWSIEYVLPISCLCAMIVMSITAKVLNLVIKDFIIYLLLDGIFGFIPAIFLALDLISYKIPSIVCVTVSVISLSAVLLFKGEEIYEELNKRMHV